MVRFDAIEVEARFERSKDEDARGYTTQPIMIPLENILDIGGPEQLVIRVKDGSTIYVCEAPSYEEALNLWRVYRLRSRWSRALLAWLGQSRS